MTDPLDAVLQRVIGAAGADDAATLAAAVQIVAAARGIDVDLRLAGRPVRPDPAVREVEAPDALLATHGHRLPGLVREQLITPTRRRRRGVHHTRADVADTVVDLASAGGLLPRIVGDPSVGGGAFLLAAAARMDGAPARVVERLVGCDVDALAVAVTESSLALWSGGVRPPAGAIRVADFLDPSPFGTASPDLIVGNPPFLGQLRDSTSRDDARRERLRSRWAGVGGYLDEAAAFLLAAADLVAPGGTVALLLPASFLSASDAFPVRARLEAALPPVALWWPGERVFGAAVDVCAVVCRSGSESGSVRRVVGVEGREHPPMPAPPAASWAPLLADLTGTPTVDVAGPPLSSLATVTAGFRDQFYGLRGAVVDDPEGAHPLVTSGLIDPLTLRWGSRGCRFDRRSWQTPTVLLDRVDEAVRPWVRARLRPKLLVASQTRVIEAVADPDGRLVPCTPVVVVEPHDPEDLWHLAAALTSPVAAAEIATHMAGSALSPDALRVSASRLRALTLPPRGSSWNTAAAAARAASTGDESVLAVGRAMLRAFPAQDQALLGWWSDRLPDGGGPPESS